MTNEDQVDKNGGTPLHLATYNGHFRICQFIVENVKVKNLSDDDGVTQLHLAALMGHSKFCQIIIENVTERTLLTKMV